MSSVSLPEKWKEWHGSGGFPETRELAAEILRRKKNSKIIAKKSELKWSSVNPNSKAASMIDARLGFTNSFMNMGVSEISPGSHSGKHKHQECYIYIISGRGYSVLDGKRYDWEEGDAIYVPPDVYHQHFNVDPDKPIRYLRMVPGPLILNLLPFIVSLNASIEAASHQAETYPEYKGAPEK